MFFVTKSGEVPRFCAVNCYMIMKEVTQFTHWLARTRESLVTFEVVRLQASYLFQIVNTWFLKLYIKNMVCIRCKMVVKDELAKLGLHYATVELGEADILENISAVQHDQFREALLKSGLELMDDKRSVLIEKIKNVIIELVHYSRNPWQ
jgi:hypothetical protein